MLISLVVALATSVAAPAKLAVAPFAVGEGVSSANRAMFDEAFAAQLRKSSTFEVLTRGELQSVLSHEKLKQLLGCEHTDCFADIGHAAGADALATGSLGRVGTSWLITLKIIDVKAVKVISSVDRRVKGGTLDDVLDRLPAAVGELVEQANRRRPTAWSKAPASPAKVAPPTAPSASGPLPKAYKDTPYEDLSIKKKLQVVTNGKGHYVAFVPENRYRGPIFAGDAKAMHEQRLFGGGRNGDISWDVVFWEPRVSARWKGAFKMREGNYALQCDDQKYPYALVEPKEATAFLAKARLFSARWQRYAKLIARDDVGTYYYVDHAREPRGNDDYRLFVGSRGRLEHVLLEDAIVDNNGAVFVSARGRLVFKNQRGKQEAIWAVGQVSKPLVALNMFDEAPMVYTKLGAYKGQALGTLCDPYLGR